MERRYKNIATVASVLCAVLLFLRVSSKFIFLDSYVRVEEERALQDLQRVTSALANDLGYLDASTADYAAWDDTYRFIADGNRDYIDNNLDDQTLIRLRINLIAYVRPSGELLYARSIDLKEGRAVPVPADLKEHLAPGRCLLRHDNLKGCKTGLITLEGRPMLVASRPVITSQYQGPIRGALIMGRYLGAEEIARLGELTLLPLQILSTDDPDQKNEVQACTTKITSSAAIHLDRAGKNLLVGNILLTDVYGRSAAVVRVDLPRQITQQGKQTIVYFIVWFILLALTILFVSLRFMGKLQASRLRRKETEHLYSSVVEHAAEGVVLISTADRRVLDANHAVSELLGYAKQEIIGRPFCDFLVDDCTLLELQMQRLAQEQQVPWMEISIRHRNGSIAIMDSCASRTSLRGEQVACLLLHDITERKRYEAELMHQASYDALTGLPNRNLLSDRLEQSLALGVRTGLPQAVLLLDLDNFKYVNDSLGHAAGDALLKQVAGRLNDMTRRYNTVARLGGDEFVILLSNITTEEVALVAERLSGLFEKPFDVEGQEVFVTVSIGISMSPTDGTTGDKLLKNADIAMYLVKEQGRNSFKFFADEMNRKIRDRLELEMQMRRALERGEFVLHYQPRVRARDGEVVGMEALIRWQPPEGLLVGPDRFIGLLEDTGLIVQVGEWVVREACRQTRAWQEDGLHGLRVSVNLSGRQFSQQGLEEMIARALRESFLLSDFLEVEITESMLMADAQQAVGKLAGIKEMGVRIAVDDFGTGYSSLAYLRRFPIDTLKIDRSFVAGVITEPGDAVIAKTIISMAHNLKLEVVAEGVETIAQLEFMRAYGCQEVQGFFFSRPLPPEEFAALVRQDRQRRQTEKNR